MLTDVEHKYETLLNELKKWQDDELLFKEYYEKAEKLYQQQLENNVNDLEMKRLKELYDQAASNGWFSN